MTDEKKSDINESHITNFLYTFKKTPLTDICFKFKEGELWHSKWNLAKHSEYFKKLFTSEFADSKKDLFDYTETENKTILSIGLFLNIIEGNIKYNYIFRFDGQTKKDSYEQSCDLNNYNVNTLVNTIYISNEWQSEAVFDKLMDYIFIHSHNYDPIYIECLHKIQKFEERDRYIDAYLDWLKEEIEETNDIFKQKDIDIINAVLAKSFKKITKKNKYDKIFKNIHRHADELYKLFDNNNDDIDDDQSNYLFEHRNELNNGLVDILNELDEWEVINGKKPNKRQKIN